MNKCSYTAFLTILLLLFFARGDGIRAQAPVRVEQLLSKFESGKYEHIDGVLAWSNGSIIGEKYAGSWDRDQPHMLQSVTKSITSLLVGAALYEGFLPDLEQPVLDFFPDYHDIQNLDDFKRALTVSDLLTMQTGMDWDEHPYEGSPLARMNAQRDDWIRFVLDHPMKQAPGHSYRYNSGGVILLGGLIRQAAGMKVQDFAERYLFNPLNISTAEWRFEDHRGLPHTGGGLYMAPKDLLKIGRLVLQCGRWEGRQIIPCDYIRAFYRNRQSGDIPDVNGYLRGYSLLWHVFPLKQNTGVDDPDRNFIAAWGARGQWLFIVPQQKLIVIFTGSTQNFREETAPVGLMYESLLSR